VLATSVNIIGASPAPAIFPIYIEVTDETPQPFALGASQKLNQGARFMVVPTGIASSIYGVEDAPGNGMLVGPESSQQEYIYNNAATFQPVANLDLIYIKASIGDVIVGNAW
jgi:hypothetical protein